MAKQPKQPDIELDTNKIDFSMQDFQQGVARMKELTKDCDQNNPAELIAALMKGLSIK